MSIKSSKKIRHLAIKHNFYQIKSLLVYSTGHYQINIIDGCIAVSVNWIFAIISSYFALFKSDSASHQAPNYVQNVIKYRKNTLKWYGAAAWRLRLLFQFT